MKREEDKSYAGWFAVWTLLLVVLGGWVIWWDAVSLRPWKQYQSEYYEMEQANLRGELQQLTARQRELEVWLGRMRQPTPGGGGTLQAAESAAGVSGRGRSTVDPEALEQELQAVEAQKRVLERKLQEVQQSEIAIQQIYLPELGRTDRCQSCHVAIDRPVAISRRQPFAPHPGHFIFLDRHPPYRFGCTLCHGGQGRATSAPQKAHGQVRYWMEPLLGWPYTSASCLKCHADTDQLRGAERLREGLELVQRYACYGCHKVPGFEARPKPGPPLTQVGEKVNYSWLVRWIKDPRSVVPDARMPNLGLSDEEAHAVADFLFSPTRAERFDLLAAPMAPERVEQGRVLYNASRCAICHSAMGRGGEFKEVYATDLTSVGSKIQRIEWLMGRIREPKKYFPDTVMPRYRFTQAQLVALASYLASEFVDFEFEEEKRHTVEPIAPSSIKYGRELVRKYGCFNCHEIAGFEKEGKIGPDLSRAASKPLEQFDFGQTPIERTRKAWFLTKLKSPRIFGPDLRMPDYHLSESEVDALTTVLLGLTGEKLPREYVVAPPSLPFVPAGEAGRLLDDLKCLTCHSIRGWGGKFAPDLSFEGSAVKTSWLREFLKSPDIIRPLLKQMPKFNLTDQEVEVLTVFITTMLQDDRIPSGDGESIPSDPRAIKAGKEIYVQRGCRACHEIEIDGGALGPNLTYVGRRLTGGYLYARSKNARAFRPEIVEPHYDFSEAEATALASFLRTLGEASSQKETANARQQP